MDARTRLAAMLIAVTFIGCKAMPQAHTEPSADSDVPDVPVPANTVKAMIADPSLHGMDAIEVTIPANWLFQGNLFLMAEGGMNFIDTCSTNPNAVYRATSPDGLSFVEQMPSPAWGWGSGPLVGASGVQSCFPIQAPTSAQQLLKYIAATLNVQYLGDEPVPADQVEKAQKMVRDANESMAKLNPTSRYGAVTRSTDLARATVRYKNGTFTMNGLLTTQVYCTETVFPGTKGSTSDKKYQAPTSENKCQASVVYAVAPESEYAGLVEQWERPGMGARWLDPWAQAWFARRMNDTPGRDAEGDFIRSERLLSWSGKLAHSKDVERVMYEQFVDVVDTGTDRLRWRSTDDPSGNHNIKPDLVDFQLDEDFSLDPETRDLRKPPAPFITWIDSTGTSFYQAMDAKATPSGVLPGSWKQEVIQRPVPMREYRGPQ